MAADDYSEYYRRQFNAQPSPQSSKYFDLLMAMNAARYVKAAPPVPPSSPMLTFEDRLTAQDIVLLEGMKILP
jgi:hypothetical protein